ncbi:MAG: FAD:protein FMN transferase [Sulfurimonas sp.]|nr:FAD:protein FMN transferase [Sulfurimonas sp.]
MRLLIFSKSFLFFFFVASTLSLDAQIISRTQILMGTYVTISLSQKNQDHLEKSFNILKKVESRLSSYMESSDISKLNKYKHSQIHPLTYEALLLSKKYYKDSDGYFDISVGSITKDLYAFGENEKIPTKKELRASFISMNGLKLTQMQASIQKNMKLDLGGMAKGFGVDKVRAYLKTIDADDFIIAASGDIRCMDRCSVDVQNPFKDEALLSFTTRKKDTGISTSGNYNRYVESVKYNHLINPKLKESQNTFVSISLVSNLSSSDLDAYATAASVMPLDKAYSFLDSYNLAYIVVQSDYKLIFSENISKFTEKLFIRYRK